MCATFLKLSAYSMCHVVVPLYLSPFSFQGMDYLLTHNLVDDEPSEIAHFLHTARHIDWDKKREFLETR